MKDSSRMDPYKVVEALIEDFNGVLAKDWEWPNELRSTLGS